MAQMSGDDIYKAFKDAGRSPSLDAAQTAAKDLQGKHQQIVNMMQSIQNQIGGAWEGQSATAAQASAQPISSSADTSQQQLGTTQDLLGRQAGSFYTAKATIKPVPPQPGFMDYLKAGGEAIVGGPIGATIGGASIGSQYANNASVSDSNVRAYTNYANASTYNGQNMPQNYGSTGPSGPGVVINPPPPPPGGQQYTGTHGGTGGTGGSTPGRTGGAYSGRAYHSPGQMSGGGYGGGAGGFGAGGFGPGSGGFGSDSAPIGTGSSSYQPGGQPGGWGSGSGTGLGAGSGDAAGGGAGGDGFGGFGAGGGSAGGSGGGAGGKFGRGAGGFGSGASTGGGAGPKGSGGASGFGAEGSGGAGRAGGAAAGAAGKSGTSGQGGMGGGGKGKGDEDGEHRSASYLQDDYSGEIVGDLGLTAPPVIGG